jgi:hypothetical protein
MNNRLQNGGYFYEGIIIPAVLIHGQPDHLM